MDIAWPSPTLASCARCAHATIVVQTSSLMRTTQFGDGNLVVFWQRHARSESGRRIRRALVVRLALTLGLLSIVLAGVPVATAAPDRAQVTLGPVESLFDRPGTLDDGVGRVLLARGVEGPIAFLQGYSYPGEVIARERMSGGEWSAVQEIPCARPEGPPAQDCHVHGAAVGADNEVVALLSTWAKPKGLAIAVSVRRGGETTWSIPRILSSGFQLSSFVDPMIRSSRQGEILVIFGVFQRGAHALVAVHARPGQALSNARFHVLPNVESAAVSGMSIDGAAVVIYTDHAGLAAPVFVSRFLPNRGFTRPTRLGSGWSSVWSVATGPGGRAIATWLETTEDSGGGSITSRSQRVRIMNVEGRWGRSHVLATGDGTSGNAVTWVSGEVGVAWDSDSPDAIRVVTKPVGRPWQRSTITSGANGGALRSLDINPAGDVVVTWENWRAAKAYSLGLGLAARWGELELSAAGVHRSAEFRARECRGPTLGRLGRLRRRRHTTVRRPARVPDC